MRVKFEIEKAVFVPVRSEQSDVPLLVEERPCGSQPRYKNTAMDGVFFWSSSTWLALFPGKMCVCVCVWVSNSLSYYSSSFVPVWIVRLLARPPRPLLLFRGLIKTELLFQPNAERAADFTSCLWPSLKCHHPIPYPPPIPPPPHTHTRWRRKCFPECQWSLSEKKHQEKKKPPTRPPSAPFTSLHFTSLDFCMFQHLILHFFFYFFAPRGSNFHTPRAPEPMENSWRCVRTQRGRLICDKFSLMWI